MVLRRDLHPGRREWMYLYGAVEEHAKVIESHLSRRRDITMAKLSFANA
jgi:transposase-like protein